MDLSFERLPEIRREQASLPSFFYNKLHLLFASIGEESLFIPIRSLQYLSIIDAEEVIFVDGQRSRYVNIAWDQFKPQQRNAIDESVDYELVLYKYFSDEFIIQLQGEFFKAVEEYENKHSLSERLGSVVPLKPDEHS